ncbi:MAG TPA: PVC-type heme-binding CxxCH protein [Planctomycetaceae bacterium]|nr:PVC-type heme-binding CxxCH protein [Planctomycetaceae bacterium]
MLCDMRAWVIRIAAVCSLCFALSLKADEPKPAADHPPPLSPAEEVKKLKICEGLEIGLVVSEPKVAQPLSISFDDRGRMWVLQYRQYPNPNGLKPVAMDEYLRTKYDKLPDPPPRGPKGQDRISIYEDTDGDGRADLVKDFVTDLNLASGMALGYGGVFVAQPPYLLFYADRDHDDHPDGPPKVLLTGFGMEDAHAFANSLTWGPDGWLYGAQGSTVTADIRGIGFQQGIWRYHPRWDQFELFSEGGGNTWGVEFDRFGNLFPAGNTAEPLEHHVQGAYLVKGFGKHGPLHNPHTYGYFQPVHHEGYLGDSLSGGAVIYQGGAFPERFNGACICPHTRHSACRWTTIETRGSTFVTRHAGDFVTSEDIWFRPVDMTVGPDGAVYIADWYDYNISHSSPKNRSEWYQPSRLDGRVWRVAPPGLAPVASNSFDLSQKTSAELIELLSHANDWYAREARRILAERCDHSVIPALSAMALESPDQRLALEGLWSIYVTAGLDGQLAAKLLESPHEYVRAWTIRLLGDAHIIAPGLHKELVRLAYDDASVVVRMQLACTAKRLPASETIPIVAGLVRHAEDVDDVQMPLLIWWAIEDKSISDTPLVLKLVESQESWRLPVMNRAIIERLSRRFFSEGSNASFAASAKLLDLAATEGDVEIVLSGMLQALAGRKLEGVPAPLEAAIARLIGKYPSKSKVLELGLRLNVPRAADSAIKAAVDRQAALEDRTALIKTLGETHTAAAVEPLIALVIQPESEAICVAAVAALGFFNDDRIGETLVDRYARLPAGAQARAVETLCGRSSWSLRLAQAIDRKQIPATAISLDLVRRLRQHDDKQLATLIEKLWGKVQTTTPLEKQGRINAVTQLLYKGKGEAAQGRAHFEKICATCHKLHEKGNSIGPDLTVAERKNRDLLVRHIVDPNSVIRQEFMAYVAQTNDGRVLTGLLADSNAQTITLVDAKNQRTVLNRADLEELKESEASLMPEKLLDELTDQQIRDLIAFIQADEPKSAGAK